MTNGFPSAGRFLYFHVDDSEEVKKAWRELGSIIGIKTSEKDTKISTASVPEHGLTTIASLKKGGSTLSMFLYKKSIIISGLLSIKVGPGSLIKKLSLRDKAWMDSVIGGATILIKERGDAEKLSSELSLSYSVIETNSGKLFQMEEREREREHVYLFKPVKDLQKAKHFLEFHFPIFDFSIHKLHMERDYFKNQRTWIIKEKGEIDKTVGDLLHMRIVGETLNPEYIESLEKAIDTISTEYAILVNDGHQIRKARTTLEEDIEEVYRHLEVFGSPPEEGLKILGDSMKLKEKLMEDETSISYAIKNTKTAMDTVRTTVDLLRSRENIFLQEEAISFQVAAGVLEFIIIFYYSIASWEHLIGTERLDFIPPPVRFISVFLFATFSVVMTHFVGVSYKQGWKLNLGMVISGAAMLLVFIYIVMISIETGTLHH